MHSWMFPLLFSRGQSYDMKTDFDTNGWRNVHDKNTTLCFFFPLNGDIIGPIDFLGMQVGRPDLYVGSGFLIAQQWRSVLVPFEVLKWRERERQSHRVGNRTTEAVGMQNSRLYTVVPVYSLQIGCGANTHRRPCCNHRHGLSIQTRQWRRRQWRQCHTVGLANGQTYIYAVGQYWQPRTVPLGLVISGFQIWLPGGLGWFFFESIRKCSLNKYKKCDKRAGSDVMKEYRKRRT